MQTVKNTYIAKIINHPNKEPDLLHGHAHFTSQDGEKAIAFDKHHNQWKMQSAAMR